MMEHRDTDTAWMLAHLEEEAEICSAVNGSEDEATKEARRLETTAKKLVRKADALRAENARLRGIINGVGVNLWDRAEISERDEAGNQTVILWHPSGMPLMRLSIESHAPRLEPAHLELVMSDLLDVLNARAAFKDATP